MKRIGFKIKTFSLYLYVRSFWKYKQFFLLPALTAEFVSRSLDLELKFLCFGIGLRITI